MSCPAYSGTRTSAAAGSPVDLLGALAMTLYADTVADLGDALAGQARRERDIVAREPG